MDKNEYKICADEIRSLIREKQYKEAVEIADTINWKNVVNTGMLCTVSDLYKICKRFEDSRDIMYLAYQRNPSGRMILYSLCELSIKLGDVVNAVEYYKEFVQIAPKDTGRFVLKYKLYTAQEVGLDERITVLEDLQKYECKEKWMYELAYLYHMNGYSEKCVEECNQIVIYFGEGKYVLKALELKALHEPLSYEQDILYKRLTAPKENDILVKEMDVSKFNTIDLQKELANSLAEVWYDDTQAKEALKAEREAERLKVERQEAQRLADEAAMKQAALEKAEEEARIREEELRAARQRELEETKVLESPVSEEKPEEDSFETKVFNIKEIAEVLKKEPGISRTVVPQKGFDEMREVMPHSVENAAIVFRNYDDMVSMEGDGQISFNVPDQEVVDKQITGQISISDVLAEFERMKNASEKKWRDDMRRKVIQQTNVIFQDFDENAKNGLLEELESEVTSNSRVELTKEEEDVLIGENLMPIRASFSETIEEPVEEPFEEQAEEPIADITVIPMVSIPGAVVTVKEPEPIEDEEPVILQDVHEIIFDEEPVSEDNVSEEAIPEEEPTPEELFFDRTPYMEKEFETEPEATISGPEPEALDNTVAIPSVGEADDYFMRFAEASEERDRIDELASADDSEEIIEGEPVEETPEEAIFEEEILSEEFPLEDEAVEEVPLEDFPLEDGEIFEDELSTEEEIPEDEIPEEEAPIEDDVEEEEDSEDIEEEADEEDTSEDAPEVIRPSGLSLEQEERFEAFIQTESGCNDVKAALSSISMEASKGNVFIGSEYSDSAVDLGVAFIKELSSKEEVGLKVGKIKASILNAKTPEVLKETLAKQYGSAVIIQDANELRPETMAVINSVIFEPDKKMFVVFTASQRGKHKFLMANGGSIPGFDVNIDIETLNIKELAAFGRAYAYSREYAIDEMGMLALHTRIEEKQSNNHCVNVTEVKRIVDEAIARATKKNPKHFFDTLVGNRYDDNDMIVLKEKDFSKGKEKTNESSSNN